MNTRLLVILLIAFSACSVVKQKKDANFKADIYLYGTYSRPDQDSCLYIMNGLAVDKTFNISSIDGFKIIHYMELTDSATLAILGVKGYKKVIIFKTK